MILVACVGLTLLAQATGQAPRVMATPVVAEAPFPSLIASKVVTTTGALFMVLPGAGSASDIYYLPPASSGPPTNLTGSAGLTEFYPTASPDGKAAAYLARNADGRIDLYVRTLPDGQAQPLTLQTTGTQLHNGFEIAADWPPRWSADGAWLAFLAKQSDGNGSAIELYIVSSRGGDLRVITTGHQVIDFAWLGSSEIAYVYVRGNDQGEIYRYRLDQSDAKPTPVATLQVPR